MTYKALLIIIIYYYIETEIWLSGRTSPSTNQWKTSQEGRSGSVFVVLSVVQLQSFNLNLRSLYLNLETLATERPHWQQ